MKRRADDKKLITGDNLVVAIAQQRQLSFRFRQTEEAFNHFFVHSNVKIFISVRRTANLMQIYVRRSNAVVDTPKSTQTILVSATGMTWVTAVPP